MISWYHVAIANELKTNPTMLVQSKNKWLVLKSFILQILSDKKEQIIFVLIYVYVMVVAREWGIQKNKNILEYSGIRDINYWQLV